MYGLSIAIFIGFAWDGKFQWWEALILLLLYIGYIIIMKFNPYLLKLLEKIECKWCRYVCCLKIQQGLKDILLIGRNESRIEPDGDVENDTVAEEPAQTNNEVCLSSHSHTLGSCMS